MIDSANADVWNNFGVALAKLGRQVESIGAFQRALAFNPSPRTTVRARDSALPLHWGSAVDIARRDRIPRRRHTSTARTCQRTKLSVYCIYLAHFIIILIL